MPASNARFLPHDDDMISEVRQRSGNRYRS